MRKRDTVRNINKLTQLMDAPAIVRYDSYKGMATSSSMKIISFNETLQDISAYTRTWRGKEYHAISFYHGVRPIDRQPICFSFNKRMIKYLIKIGVILELEKDAHNRRSLMYNLGAYKLWCEKYNLPVSKFVAGQ
jgi:hypothetical protein